MARQAPDAGNRKRKLKAEINVVPYIDVMLVLLIIFAGHRAAAQRQRGRSTCRSRTPKPLEQNDKAGEWSRSPATARWR